MITAEIKKVRTSDTGMEYSLYFLPISVLPEGTPRLSSAFNFNVAVIRKPLP